MLKRVLRAAAAAIALLVTVVAAGLVLLTLPPGEKVIRSFLQSQLTVSLGQEVAIAALETNLFSRIQLQGVEVAPIPDDNSQPVISVDSLKVKYSLWKLVFGDLRLESVEISGVQVQLKRDGSGRFNLVWLDSLSQEGDEGAVEDDSAASTGLGIGFGEFHLRNLSLSFEDELLLAGIAVHNLGLSIESDSPDSYFGEVTSDSFQVGYKDLPPVMGRLSASGGLQGVSFSLDTLLLSLGELNLTGAGRMELTDSTDLALELALAGDPRKLLQAAQLVFQLPPLKTGGDLKVDLSVGGNLLTPVVAAQVELPSLTAAGIEASRLFSKVRWQNESLQVDSLSLALFGGIARATGEVASGAVPVVRGRLSFSDIDVVRVSDYAFESPAAFSGKLNGTVDVAGEEAEVLNWKVASTLRSRQLRYRGRAVSDLDASLSLTGGVASLNLRQEFVTAKATANLDSDSLRGQFEMSVAQLQPLAALAGLAAARGSLDARGELGGDIRSPEVQIDIRGEQISYQDFPVDELEASVTYSDSIVRVRSLKASGRLAKIDTLQPPFAVDGLTGGFNYSLSASGTLDDPAASLEASFDQPAYMGVMIDSGSLSADLRGRELKIERLELRRDSLRLVAEGRYDLSNHSGDFAARLSAADTSANIGVIEAIFDLSDTSDLTVSCSAQEIDVGYLGTIVAETLDVGGILAFDFNADGSLAEPEINLAMTLDDAHYGTVSLDSATAAVSFRQALLELQQLEANVLGQKLKAQASATLTKDSSGYYTLSDESYLAGSVEAARIDLALARPFLAEPTQVEGEASINVAWSGAWEDLSVRGRCAVNDARVKLDPETDPIEGIDFRLSFVDSVVSIDTASAMFMGRPLKLSGSLTASEWERFQLDLFLDIAGIGEVRGEGSVTADSLDLTARVDSLDLNLLQELLPDLDSLSGRLGGRLILRGSSDSPVVHGSAVIQDLAVKPAGFSEGFDRGLVELRFAEDSLQIDTLILRQGNGVVTVGGGATLRERQISDINLYLNAADVLFSRPDEFIVRLRSARLSYNTDKELYQLRGDLVLDESRLTLSFEPESVLPWAETVERAETEMPRFLQQTRIDIRLRESNKLWIDNNLARMRLHAELGVIGSPASPNLTGRLAVEEGYLLYLDRKFEVERGAIYFTDPSQFNPEIDLLAQTKVTGYEGIRGETYVISITMQGPLDALQISLTSQPPLDKPDIVSMLTLGATRNQLAGKDANGEDVLLRRAESITSRRISGLVSNRIESLLGLDQVSVDGNLFNPARSQGIQLLAAKQISDRARLTYTTTVGQLNEQSIRLDYRLSRHFSLEGETNRRGAARIGFKYGLLFR